MLRKSKFDTDAAAWPERLKLADAVKVTLGPKGRVAGNHGAPLITNDVTVAKGRAGEPGREHGRPAGARGGREINVAGDGTTTCATAGVVNLRGLKNVTASADALGIAA